MIIFLMTHCFADIDAAAAAVMFRRAYDISRLLSLFDADMPMLTRTLSLFTSSSPCC